MEVWGTVSDSRSFQRFILKLFSPYSRSSSRLANIYTPTFTENLQFSLNLIVSRCMCECSIVFFLCNMNIVGLCAIQTICLVLAIQPFIHRTSHPLAIIFTCCLLVQRGNNQKSSDFLFPIHSFQFAWRIRT